MSERQSAGDKIKKAGFLGKEQQPKSLANGHITISRHVTQYVYLIKNGLLWHGVIFI